jgi:hypothetical protein
LGSLSINFLPSPKKIEPPTQRKQSTHKSNKDESLYPIAHSTRNCAVHDGQACEQNPVRSRSDAMFGKNTLGTRR